MKKFVMEQPFLELFPDAKVGTLICRGIDNHVKDPQQFAEYLRECEKLAAPYYAAEEFTDNPIVRTWRDAFSKFKTKKGARCSIEALLKRVMKGGEIGCINPLVDIYNGISLKYGVPIGGEDFDKFDGDNRLTVADGSEEFVTLGSDKSEPPYPGEVVYKDRAGAICRCFNWRESVRTMLTEDTSNAFMVIETVAGERDDVLESALAEMAELIRTNLGGEVTMAFADREHPEIIIEE